MNEQLQAQLAQILAQIMVSVGEVKDFSIQQLPDIAQQYITYGFWSSVFYVGISILPFLASVIILLLTIHNALKHSHFGDIHFAKCMSSICVGMISGAALFNNIHKLILIKTAPKIWFILEVKNLIS